MHNKKILLVDDDEYLLSSLSRELSKRNYDITKASSGKEAIKALLNNHFHLVITDLLMPGVNGLQVLQAAKKKNPDICVLILTGHGNMVNAIEALRSGADDYLIKPCYNDEINFRISHHLKKQEASLKLRLYENILPICTYCKKIRDDSDTKHGHGEWLPFEEYRLYLKEKGFQR